MERVPDRWLDPPDEGPAICDYCGKETDPDELESINQKNGLTAKYACPACFEKHACVDCPSEADTDFVSPDGKARCEPCYFQKYARPCCGELPEYCECKRK